MIKSGSNAAMASISGSTIDPVGWILEGKSFKYAGKVFKGIPTI